MRMSWGFANSQALREWAQPPPDAPVRLEGMRLGGGETLGIAQERCPYWIEGMVRLLSVIFEPGAVEADLRTFALERMNNDSVLDKFYARREAEYLTEQAAYLSARADRLMRKAGRLSA